MLVLDPSSSTVVSRGTRCAKYSRYKDTSNGSSYTLLRSANDTTQPKQLGDRNERTHQVGEEENTPAGLLLYVLYHSHVCARSSLCVPVRHPNKSSTAIPGVWLKLDKLQQKLGVRIPYGCSSRELGQGALCLNRRRSWLCMISSGPISRFQQRVCDTDRPAVPTRGRTEALTAILAMAELRSYP